MMIITKCQEQCRRRRKHYICIHGRSGGEYKRALILLLSLESTM